MPETEENPVFLVTTDFVAPPDRLDEAVDLYRRRVASIPPQWETVLFTDEDASGEDVPDYIYWRLLTESSYRPELGNPCDMEAFRVRTVIRVASEDLLDHPKIEEFFLEDLEDITHFSAMVTPTPLRAIENTGMAAEDISPTDRSFEWKKESLTIDNGTWIVEFVYLGTDVQDSHIECLQRVRELAGVTLQSVGELTPVDDTLRPDIVGPLWVQAGHRNIRGYGDGLWPPGMPAYSARVVLDVAEDRAVNIASAVVERLEGDSQVLSRVVASRL